MEVGLVVSVRYFEIPVSDMGRAHEFYETVFGIALKRATVDGYEMALFPEVAEGLGASGALAIGDVYVPGKAGPILYFTVESIDEVFDRLSQIDGKVLYPKKALDPEGYVAEFEDSEGNRIALYQPL